MLGSGIHPNTPSLQHSIPSDLVGGFNGIYGANAENGGGISAHAFSAVTADNGKPNTSIAGWIDPAINTLPAAPAFSFDGGQAVASSSPITNLGTIVSGQVALGPAPSLGHSLRGTMSSVSIFSNSLSQEQVRSLFDAMTTNVTLASPSIAAGNTWSIAAQVGTPTNSLEFHDDNYLTRTADKSAIELHDGQGTSSGTNVGDFPFSLRGITENDGHGSHVAANPLFAGVMQFTTNTYAEDTNGSLRFFTFMDRDAVASSFGNGMGSITSNAQGGSAGASPYQSLISVSWGLMVARRIVSFRRVSWT